MLKKSQFLILTAIAFLSLILVVVNAILFSQNRVAQAAVATRQQFIQQSVPLDNLYQQMVKALAELSSRSNDEQIKAILSAQGIRFSSNSNSPENGPGAAPVTTK